MKKISVLSFAMLLIGTTLLHSQDKKLSLDDYYKNIRNLSPSTIEQIKWISGTNKFSCIENNTLVINNVLNNNKEKAISLGELNKELIQYDIPELKRFPSIDWKTNNEFIIQYHNKFIGFDLKSGKSTQIISIPDNAENIEYIKEKALVAYTIDNNLYYNDTLKQYQVTAEVNKGIVCGKTVHRNEFGINGGIFWSPQSNYLAFYRMDESMVTDYPLIEISDVQNRIAETDLIKYPMAGMKSHEVTLGVYNLKTAKTVYLKTGEPKDHYLTSVTWSPDEKYVYIGILNREQNYLKLNKYDVITGDFVTSLFEERNSKYVEPEHSLIFIKKDATRFIYYSKRDGFNHLYLYTSDGKCLKQLTSGNYNITEVLGFDETGNNLYYVSTEISPLDRAVYCLNLKNNKKTLLTTTRGTHTAMFSDDGKYFVDYCSSIEIASEYNLHDATGKPLRQLLIHKNPLKDYSISNMSIFKIKADDDSTDLYCRLIKPANFDSTKKYPVIIYVYGGPHNQLISNTWLGDAGFFLHYLAQQGYIVFSLDNRGSAERGLAFEQAIHRKIGEVECRDQLQGVKYLKKLNYIDTTRFGIHGWSYGGFLTMSLLLKNPGLFKVAVAGGPVIDWKLYEIMYGERYMDSPQENKVGYDKACLLNYTKNLTGKLLIIHGGMDNTVVMQHSMLFLKKCIEEGKQLDFFVYPHHEHNVSGKDRIHLFHKIENYFNDYL